MGKSPACYFKGKREKHGRWTERFSRRKYFKSFKSPGKK